MTIDPVLSSGGALVVYAGGTVTGLTLDADDASAQLAGGPQRIEQLQVVIREQRRGERPQHLQGGAAA